jgi:hypothetical protein
VFEESTDSEYNRTGDFNDIVQNLSYFWLSKETNTQPPKAAYKTSTPQAKIHATKLSIARQYQESISPKHRPSDSPNKSCRRASKNK